MNQVLSDEEVTQLCEIARSCCQKYGQFVRAIEAAVLAKFGEVVHYPDCWDTAAYLTILDAIKEMSICTNDDCALKKEYTE